MSAVWADALRPAAAAADTPAAAGAATAAARCAAGSLRRARPLLGTLVEVGLVPGAALPGTALTAAFFDTAFDAAFDAAFGAITAVQAALSRFDAHSDIARFTHLPAGASLALRPAGARALRAAQALRQASGGLFDISLGTGPQAWHCAGGRLHKRASGVQLDLGGIAKGHAVDAAVHALRLAGCAAGWVNAGGDLRVFGAIDLPLRLRDEATGGVWPVGTLADGAFATSRFAPGSRCQVTGAGAGAGSRVGSGSGVAAGVMAHVSVAAPHCLWADALTKIVAASGDMQHPLLARLGASAWLIAEQPDDQHGG